MGVPAQKAGRAVMRHAWHHTCERIQRPKRTIQHHLYVTPDMTAKLTLRLDEQLIAAAKDTMEGAAHPAVTLNVHLAVEAGQGRNWAEAH